MLADDNYSDPPLLGMSGNDLLGVLRPCELHPNEQPGFFEVIGTTEIPEFQDVWQKENVEDPEIETEVSVAYSENDTVTHALACYREKETTIVDLYKEIHKKYDQRKQQERGNSRTSETS